MPKISFTPVVLPHHRRPDGTYPVKIRMSFKGKSKYIDINRTAVRKDLTRDLRLREGPVLDACRDLASRMRRASEDIPLFALDDMDIDEVYRLVLHRLEGQEELRLDFFEFADGWIARRREAGIAEQTAHTYTVAINALERWLGERRLQVNAITSGMVNEFGRSLGRKPCASMYCMRLGTIFNAARKEYNDEEQGIIRIPRKPFARLDVEVVPHRSQRSLGVELMQKVISAQASGAERMALDAFVVSFGLMGANLADMWDALPPKGRVWIYERRKTSFVNGKAAEMRVVIPEEIGPWIRRLRGKGRHWFNVLHRNRTVLNSCTGEISRRLKAWARREGVEPFTFYAARHTWATLARKAGVDKATIDECLAHVGSLRMADIYIEKDWDIINEANRKVLALFDWK